MTKLHNEGKGHQRGAAMRRRFGILRPRQHQNPLHVPLYAVYQVPRYDEIKYIQNSPPGYQVGSCFALTCRDIYIYIHKSQCCYDSLYQQDIPGTPAQKLPYCGRIEYPGIAWAKVLAERRHQTSVRGNRGDSVGGRSIV